MKIGLSTLNDQALRDKGYELPDYDVTALRAHTLNTPRWIHFGAGNLFRAFIAAAADRTISLGALTTGIIACGTADEIASAYTPSDNVYVSVTLAADGNVKKQLVGCVAQALAPDTPRDFDALRALFRMPSLQLVSFTITEKGYDATGVRECQDMSRAAGAPQSLLGQLCALMYERYLADSLPLALVSMDNCSRNGERLKNGLLQMSRAWIRLGRVEPGFEAYLEGGRVSFPWTMIDKITPRPNPDIAHMLKGDGLSGIEIRATALGGWFAPFVNAEEIGYLVIEDDFPAGRPDLAACGFLLTDRETVSKAERMKVCTCLNPLHTALAVFGCLLNYTRISDAMHDVDLVALINRLGYGEGMPVVTDPGIIDPAEFLKTVLEVRFPNPFMPDSPQRIAADTSQKLAIRFGETIKAHVALGDAGDLRAVPLVLAGWLRYLTAIDDQGRPFELSPDPMLPALEPLRAHLAVNGSAFDESVVLTLLKDEKVFGLDLEEAGLAQRVLDDLRAMLTGPGAVRDVLRREANHTGER